MKSEELEQARTRMQAVHDGGENYEYAWRIKQLQALRSMLTEHWDEWINALMKDLGKCRVEAVSMELQMVKTELLYTMKNLKTWMQPKLVPSPGLCMPAFSRLEERPLSNAPAVLIIGPSNYPVSLVLHPMIGALAAGNPVVCKPSELTETVEAVFARLIPQYFDPNAVVCVTGGIPETESLLQVPWGKIFFTGSAAVGRIVAKAAAATLTPVTLELGGKSPCYVDGETCPTTADWNQVANRILWSKTVNAGQTCAATDTLVMDECLVPKLLPALKESLRNQYGDDPKTSDFARIVSTKHAKRLLELIQEVESRMKDNDNKHTKILTGGSAQCDVGSKYIAPTLILNPPWDCRLMKEEIFGPILPIITVANRAAAIQFMRQTVLPSATPLCLYVFTSSETVFQEISRQIPAGSVMRNDCLIHLSSPYIPFGGLGTSGYGNYHGKYTFDTFSHTQPVMYRPCFPGFDFGMFRFHPFGRIKGYLLSDVFVGLPAVPVLHLRLIGKLLLAAVVGGLLLRNAPADLRTQCAERLANRLDAGASWLRRSAGEG